MGHRNKKMEEFVNKINNKESHSKESHNKPHISGHLNVNPKLSNLGLSKSSGIHGEFHISKPISKNLGLGLGISGHVSKGPHGTHITPNINLSISKSFGAHKKKKSPNTFGYED